MSSDTSFDALELEKVNRDIKEWEEELVSIANRNNPERRGELGGRLREARQTLEAIKDDLARHDNGSKGRSPELAEPCSSNVYTQSRDPHREIGGLL